MSHAIVIGGSITGLLAARVLLNHFDHVTLLERDHFPNTPRPRLGVPQSQHVHALLMQGHQILETLFPGLTTDLVNKGAHQLNWTADWRCLTLWDWLPEHVSKLQGLNCSRLLLEWYLRDRLLQIPRFTIQEATLVTALVTNDDKEITGVVVANDRTSKTLATDWVVDASGRNSKLADWLVELGYQRPSVTSVNSFLGYASRWYRRPAQADLKGLIVAARRGVTRRGAMLYPVEGNRCIVTLTGIEKDYPPADDAGFLAFAQGLRDSTIAEAIATWEPISPIKCYRRTENYWHHYDKLPALPDGLVALGDAVCAFNPIYGQGMTTAALGTVLLDQCLQRRQRRGLGLRFQRQLASKLLVPWLMATNEDFRWPMTTGTRPSWLSQRFQHYFDRVMQAATLDNQIHCDFMEVAHLVKGPSQLLHPRTVWKALTLPAAAKS